MLLRKTMHSRGCIAQAGGEWVSSVFAVDAFAAQEPSFSPS